jgi:hypothetical protein
MVISVGEKSHSCRGLLGFESPVEFFTQANTFIKHLRIIPQAHMYWEWGGNGIVGVDQGLGL